MPKGRIDPRKLRWQDAALMQQSMKRTYDCAFCNEPIGFPDEYRKCGNRRAHEWCLQNKLWTEPGTGRRLPPPK